MGSLGFIQLFINIVLGLGVGFLWIRLMRPQKDDPRLSRGLQLLQNKIAVLEDLSDRTDHQVKQLSLLMEEKAKGVQKYIENAQVQIELLNQSMKKSRDVARIFEDKIPHDEIIDRQNTIKYVKAAQMAHQGKSLEEIEQEIDIPRSELEFIAKVNREKLMFSPENLPDWVKDELVESDSNALPSETIEKAYREAFQPPPPPSQALSNLGDEFRKAVADMEPEVIEASEAKTTLQFQDEPELSPIEFALTKMTGLGGAEKTRPASQPHAATSAPAQQPAADIITGKDAKQIRKYEFPRVNLTAKR